MIVNNKHRPQQQQQQQHEWQRGKNLKVQCRWYTFVLKYMYEQIFPIFYVYIQLSAWRWMYRTSTHARTHTQTHTVYAWTTTTMTMTKRNNNNTYRMSPWRFFSRIVLSRWIGLTAKTYEKKKELIRMLIRTCTVLINDHKCNFCFSRSLNTMKHPHQNIITFVQLNRKNQNMWQSLWLLNGWILQHCAPNHRNRSNRGSHPQSLRIWWWIHKQVDKLTTYYQQTRCESLFVLYK